MMLGISIMDGLIQDWGIVQEMVHEAVEIAERKPKEKVLVLTKVDKKTKVKGILGLADSKSLLYYLEKSEKLLEHHKVVVHEPFSWVLSSLQILLEITSYIREFDRPKLRFKLKYQKPSIEADDKKDSMTVSNNKKPDAASMQLRVFFQEAYADAFTLSDDQLLEIFDYLKQDLIDLGKMKHGSDSL